MLLGSSGYSAQLAGMLGLPYAFAHHFDIGTSISTLDAVAVYRQSFRPSRALDEPYTIVTAGVLAAETVERAEYLAAPARLAMLALRTGRRLELVSPAEAAQHPDLEVARAMPSNRIVGDARPRRRTSRRPCRAHAGGRGDDRDDDARLGGADRHHRDRGRHLGSVRRLRPLQRGIPVRHALVVVLLGGDDEIGEPWVGDVAGCGGEHHRRLRRWVEGDDLE